MQKAFNPRDLPTPCNDIIQFVENERRKNQSKADGDGTRRARSAASDLYRESKSVVVTPPWC
jgi:hypothetical protein